MPKAINDLAFDAVSELLEYAPDINGACLRWKVGKGSRAKAGQAAGSLNQIGYYQVRLNGRLYLAHRLVWLLTKGAWPKEHLDHIDRNPGNNRIENLRECTHAENQQNKGRQSNNTSGLIGVSWSKQAKKWHAQIWISGKRKHLGYFDTPQEAAEVYTEAKKEIHEFHPEVTNDRQG